MFYIFKELIVHTAVKGVSKTPIKSSSFPASSPSLVHCCPQNTSHVPLKSRPTGTPPYPALWSQLSPPSSMRPSFRGFQRPYPEGGWGPTAVGTVELHQKTKVIKGLIRPPTQGHCTETLKMCPWRCCVIFTFLDIFTVLRTLGCQGRLRNSKSLLWALSP